MTLINVPDPDPFLDRMDAKVGLEKPDRNHQVKCEECGRFLKSKSQRCTHVMCLHPLTSYQCPYHPNRIFYTKESLITHCKKVHVLCDLCDTMWFDQAAHENHYSRRHPRSPTPKLVQADLTATASPITGDEADEEQLLPGKDDIAVVEPVVQRAVASKAADHPDRNSVGRYICSFCKVVCDTEANYKLHLNQHKKVLCKFYHRKFLGSDGMEEHVAVMHHDKKQPQYRCKVSDCKERFATHVESLEHLRRNHRSQFRFRCRSCMESFTNLEELFSHGIAHEERHLPIQGVWLCSICAEKFNNLHRLMEHMGTHAENSYQCDECNCKFSLVSELTIHSCDVHATRKFACYFCPEYFSTGDESWKHRKDKHWFVCENCQDVLPSQQELEAHQVEKHGGPVTEDDTRREQQREAAEKRQKLQEQRGKRKEAAEAAQTTKHFGCTECLMNFKTRRELDDHTATCHTFVCKVCYHIMKTSEELDVHLESHTFK